MHTAPYALQALRVAHGLAKSEEGVQLPCIAQVLALTLNGTALDTVAM